MYTSKHLLLFLIYISTIVIFVPFYLITTSSFLLEVEGPCEMGKERFNKLHYYKQVMPQCNIQYTLSDRSIHTSWSHVEKVKITSRTIIMVIHLLP
jgi:hypothetical protein